MSLHGADPATGEQSVLPEAELMAQRLAFASACPSVCPSMHPSKGHWPLHTHLEATVKRQATTHVGEAVEKSEPSHAAGGNVKWSSCFAKQSGRSSKSYTHTHTHIHTANIKLRYDPAIPLLSIRPRGLNICCHKNLCANARSRVFILPTRGKQPKQPSTDERRKELALSILWNIPLPR